MRKASSAYCEQVGVNLQQAGSTNHSCNAKHVGFKAEGRDPNVGTGFRLLMIETKDPDTGEDAMACWAQAAYSAKTNMSQAVLIKKGVLCLSAHDGWKYTVDWEGVPTMVSCTNAVPDKVYPKGL